jgi:hypothetical protein
MREWCRRDDFRGALPELLKGEDPAFADYIRKVAQEEAAAVRDTGAAYAGVRSSTPL